MADVYKTLGKLAPTDDREYVLYTASANSAIASSLTVTNRSTSAQKFSLNVYTYEVNQAWLGDSNTFILLSNGVNAATSTNASSWSTGAMPAAVNWKRSAYGNNVFVAVASGTSISATSTNGTTWTQRSMPSSQSWDNLAFGNGIFVASAPFSNPATSTDGITWTTRTVSTSYNWTGLAFGNGIFVLMSGYNSSMGDMNVQLSTDGITWTRNFNPFGDYTSVKYVNNRFVAIGKQNVLYGFSASVHISTNGVDWPSYSMPNATWSPVAYGNNTYVSVASGNSIAVTSSDGTTWTQRTLPESNTWIDVEWSSSRNFFYAITSTSPGRIVQSTDGINWVGLSNLPLNATTDINIITIPYSSPAVRRIYQDYEVPANETLILDPGICIRPGYSIVAKGNSNLTLRLSGVETDQLKYGLLVQKYAGTYSSSIYSVPGNQAIIRAITITNTSSSTPDTYSLAISDSQYSGIQNSDKILENIAIMPNETITIKPAYGLENDNTIWVNSANGSSTTQVFGMEF